MGAIKIVIAVLIVAVILVASGAMFTVDERERAIMFKFGEIVRDDFIPGFYFKIPIVNNIRKFDNRILTLDAAPERYLTSEKKNVIVDSFVKWRIDDVTRYFTGTGGDPNNANQRLAQIIKNGLRDEFGKRTIQEIISGERSQIVGIIKVLANTQVKELGLTVVDIRLKRIDLPPEVSTSVYLRMEAERERVAKELRSRGAEAAERIEAEADRKRTILLAEAFRDAERMRGEGDGKAANIYAKAYKKNAEFYELYRSLNAYKTTFSDKSDILIIKPDTKFFKYFTDPKKTTK